MLVQGDRKFIPHRFEDESEFERLISRFSDDVFGPSSLFFGRAVLSGTGVPPTLQVGIAIDLESWHWFIIQFARSSDAIWSELAPSITEKLLAAANAETQRFLIQTIVEHYKARESTRQKFQDHRISSIDVRKVLEEIFHGAPVVAIFSEEFSQELSNFAKVLKPDTQIIRIAKFADSDDPDRILYELPDRAISTGEDPPDGLNLTTPCHRRPPASSATPRPAAPPTREKEPDPIVAVAPDPELSLPVADPDLPTSPPQPPRPPALSTERSVTPSPEPLVVTSENGQAARLVLNFPSQSPSAPDPDALSEKPSPPIPDKQDLAAEAKRRSRISEIRHLIEESGEAAEAYGNRAEAPSIPLERLIRAGLLSPTEVLFKSYRLRNGQMKICHGEVGESGSFSVRERIVNPGDAEYTEVETPGWITSDRESLLELKCLCAALSPTNGH